jgi:stage V sporulation protein K
MDRFLQSNPGLRSRFQREIVFPDYTTAELLEITRRFAAEAEYVLDKTAEAALVGNFERAERGEGFGNARFARTLFELTLNAQALRLAAHYGASLDQLELVNLHRPHRRRRSRRSPSSRDGCPTAAAGSGGMPAEAST